MFPDIYLPQDYERLRMFHGKTKYKKKKITEDTSKGGLGRLALAMWACWSAGQVGRHVKC